MERFQARTIWHTNNAGQKFVLVSNPIVGDVLTLDNYDDWKVWMKSYLVGQNLWDTVEGIEPEEDTTHVAWRAKNGRALHAIQISCGSQMFSFIKNLTSAREAWDLLANNYKSSWDRRRKIIDDRSSHWQKMKQGGDGCENLSNYRDLYNAAFKGDWKAIKSFLDDKPDARAASIDKWSSTALHIAAQLGNENFVVEMVKIMSRNDLKRPNDVGSTAFHSVTEGGTKKMAEVMMNKDSNLLNIRDGNGMTPLLSAAIFNNHDVLLYLYSQTRVTDLCFNPSDSALLLHHLITTDLYDLALDLLRCCPKCATTEAIGETALQVLARRPSAFKSGCQLGFWHTLIYSCVRVKLVDSVPHVVGHAISINQEEPTNVHPMNQLLWNRSLWNILQQLVPGTKKVLTTVLGIKKIRKTKLMHMQAKELVKRLFKEVLKSKNDYIMEESLGPPLLSAAKFGIVEFLTVALESYPRLIEYPDAEMRSIFQIAVLNRQEKIFNILKKLGRQMTVRTFDKDIYLNNILHLAGKIAPSHRLNSVSGAALQMQRELQWFMEVEKIVPPTYKEWNNSQGTRPQVLFTEEHKDLVANGEKWIKETASSCSAAGALILGIMFAAAFTIPGGVRSETGIPLFQNTASMIFVVSDAIALFCSATSLLMFFSILTSRYAENDFLLSLPTKLIIGVALVFSSVAAMMVAFGATIFITFSHHLVIVSILLTLLAAIPSTLFAYEQFPLFIDAVLSTYGSGISGRSHKV